MKFVLAVLISVIIFLAGIRYIEKHSIYFPMRQVVSTPALAGLAYEDIYFTTQDGKTLNGWYIPAEKAAYTVLFCHGNAGNIGHRLYKISMLHEMGLNVFIFDYRGYGKSEGSPDEQGLYSDGDAAYDYLIREKKVSPRALILYGESIGGAVAIDIAERLSVKAIITEETFTSVKDMMRIAFPFLPYHIFSSRFDSASKIQDITCPKLIMHSVDDEIVPYYLGVELFGASAGPKKFLKLRGGHNTAFMESGEKYREGIKFFIESL